LRSSRIYIIDTQPDPARPHIAKIIEPEEVIKRSGYSRPHTVHCGPDAIYVSALGSHHNGDGPGGIFMLDHTISMCSAPGKSIAARSTWPTISGGTSPMTP
jgi:methanethiol oxidase